MPTKARRVAEPSDLRQIEAKWQSVWEREQVYVARADARRPKWYSNVPYPYMNGYQHLGFGTSFLRAEFQSRFRRMLGYNVLHPQAFHCTGLPILGAAKRIAEKEPKQWEILRAMGIPDREIPKFADPMHWIEVFPAATMEDLKALGAAVDWTRSFITTPLNPPYDAFVRWQFHRLKDGGYVIVFPDLSGCLTQADDFEEINAMAEEARRLWIETEYDLGADIPLPTQRDK